LVDIRDTDDLLRRGRGWLQPLQPQRFRRQQPDLECEAEQRAHRGDATRRVAVLICAMPVAAACKSASTICTSGLPAWASKSAHCCE
jgi:hypothetical protein